MKNFSRRKFLALGCCTAGAALCPAFLSSADAAPNQTEVNKLFSQLGSEKKSASGPGCLDR